MTSDNGKPGQVDLFDVFAAIAYIEDHYKGSVQLMLERGSGPGAAEMLCHLSFVPANAARGAAASFLLTAPAQARCLRALPQRLHDLVLDMHESLDTAPAGTLVFGYHTW